MTAPVRVVVLGASGFIGGRIYEDLAALKTYTVTGYSSADCDLLDAERVKRVLEPYGADTTVVFCSAIRRTRDDSFTAFLQNVTMVHNFLDALPSGGLRSVVFFSSVDVYGRPPAVLPTNETSPTRPTEYYGAAKLAGESFLQIRLADRCPLTVLRIPGVYGFGDQFRSVIGSFLRQVQQGETVTLTGDGGALRDYVEVSDASRFTRHMVENPYDGTLNLVTGRSVRIRDLVEEIGVVTGKMASVKLRPDLDSKGDLVWDAQLIWRLYPEMQFLTVETGIARYAQAMRATLTTG